MGNYQRQDYGLFCYKPKVLAGSYSQILEFSYSESAELLNSFQEARSKEFFQLGAVPHPLVLRPGIVKILYFPKIL